MENSSLSFPIESQDEIQAAAIVSQREGKRFWRRVRLLLYVDCPDQMIYRPLLYRRFFVVENCDCQLSSDGWTQKSEERPSYSIDHRLINEVYTAAVASQYTHNKLT